MRIPLGKFTPRETLRQLTDFRWLVTFWKEVRFHAVATFTGIVTLVSDLIVGGNLDVTGTIDMNSSNLLNPGNVALSTQYGEWTSSMTLSTTTGNNTLTWTDADDPNGWGGASSTNVVPDLAGRYLFIWEIDCTQSWVGSRFRAFIQKGGAGHEWEVEALGPTTGNGAVFRVVGEIESDGTDVFTFLVFNGYSSSRAQASKLAVRYMGPT